LRGSASSGGLIFGLGLGIEQRGFNSRRVERRGSGASEKSRHEGQAAFRLRVDRVISIAAILTAPASDLNSAPYVR